MPEICDANINILGSYLRSIPSEIFLASCPKGNGCSFLCVFFVCLECPALYSIQLLLFPLKIHFKNLHFTKISRLAPDLTDFLGFEFLPHSLICYLAPLIYLYCGINCIYYECFISQIACDLIPLCAPSSWYIIDT